MMTSRYQGLPELRGGYSLEDFSVVVDGTAHTLSSFGFHLLSHSDMGVAPIQQRVGGYILRTGAQYDGYRVGERVVLLTGRFYGASVSYVDSEMARLVRLIVGNEILLRSNVAARQLTCYYTDGLTGNNATRNGQPSVLRFVAYNPWWQALVNETPKSLTNGANTVTYNGTARGLPVITLASTANGQVVTSVGCTTNDGVIVFSGLTLDNGDTLVIDLSNRTSPVIAKNSASVWSNVDASTSSMTRMVLLPGDNTITLTAGASVTGTISWTERYWSIDR